MFDLVLSLALSMLLFIWKCLISIAFTFMSGVTSLQTYNCHPLWVIKFDMDRFPTQQKGLFFPRHQRTGWTSAYLSCCHSGTSLKSCQRKRRTNASATHHTLSDWHTIYVSQGDSYIFRITIHWRRAVFLSSYVKKNLMYVHWQCWKGKFSGAAEEDVSQGSQVAWQVHTTCSPLAETKQFSLLVSTPLDGMERWLQHGLGKPLWHAALQLGQIRSLCMLSTGLSRDGSSRAQQQ